VAAAAAAAASAEVSAHSAGARFPVDSIPAQQSPALQHGGEPSADEAALCAVMIAATWPGCSSQFTKALCRLMIKGQSMQYYGAAAKKGAAAKNGEKIAMLALSNVAERGIDSRGHALVMGPSHCDYWL
jgi:hypothetical protein